MKTWHVRAALAFAAISCASSAALAQDLPAWSQEKLAGMRNDAKALDSAYKRGAKLASFCAACHGEAGHSPRPEVPNLAGQNTAYVVAQLEKFAQGQRRGAFFMEGLVKAMSKDERIAVAVYYTSQPPASLPVKDAALAARGRQVFEGICKACHGERGAGNETIARIAGQQPEYLEASIKRYREGVRLDPRMLVSLRSLSDADIKAVTVYIGSL